jgi:hypothetical protein
VRLRRRSRGPLLAPPFFIWTPLDGESHGRQLPSRNAERLEAFREKTSLQEARELCRIVPGDHIEVGFRPELLSDPKAPPHVRDAIRAGINHCR